MRTTEDRIERVERRTKRLRRKREMRMTAALSVAGALCAFGLVGTIGLLGSGAEGTFVISGTYGSSILFDSASGYVFVAIIVFVIASTITSRILRHRRAHLLGQDASLVPGLGKRKDL